MQRPDVCRPPEGTAEPGVCLHIGLPDARGGAVACFTVNELRDGQAFIGTNGKIVGLAPDGAVTATAAGEQALVRGNVFRLPGGPQTRVGFRR